MFSGRSWYTSFSGSCSWGDLAAYSCGIGFGILIDYAIESYLKAETGRTGRLFAQSAVAKNHNVTAIIRDKTKATLAGVT
jgi:hypothetical protein